VSWFEQRRYIANPNTVTQRVSGALVVLQVESGHYYSLDGVGERIWELLTQGQTLGAVAQILSAEYDAPLAQIRQDVEELTEELSRERLLLDAPAD
jgi:hypothetical protein